jgi:hypothetical protein
MAPSLGLEIVILLIAYKNGGSFAQFLNSVGEGWKNAE